MEIEKNISLAKFSSLRVGGPADFFARISSIEGLQNALKFARDKKLRILILGAGTNILFSDAGFRGIVLKIENRGVGFATKKVRGRKIEFAQIAAGENLAKFVRTAAEKNFDFAELCGIFGSVGGAIAQNAGAMGAEISDFLVSANLVDLKTGKLFVAKKPFFQF